MSSFFEPDSSFLFDPHSQMEEVPTSFLSFSSFAALANIASSPWSLSSPDSDTKSHRKSEYFHPSGSDASTPPSSSDEYNTLERSLEPVTPHFSSCGLFQSTSHAGSSKPSGDIWTSPRTPTPTLLSKASIESIAEVTQHSTQSRLVSPSPLRTTSNPVLGSTYRPKKVKPVASMPALNEEEAAFYDQDVDSIFASLEASAKNDSVQDDVLAEDFGWVFSDYGLGASSSGSSQGVVPADSTIFAAFQSDQGALDNPFSTQDVDSLFGFVDPAPTFTIDPMEFMGSLSGFSVEQRPSSSLGFGEGSGSLMSIPMGDVRSRSCSSDDMSQRSAPVQDPFSYVPPQTQTYYSTGDNMSYVVPQQQVMPPTPTQSRRPSKNMPRQGLSVQINPNQPTYRSSSMGLPPTPASASFDNMSSQQPLPIARNGRIPLSRSSGSSGSNAEPDIPMPPVVARAAAIVAMQEAKQEAERQAYRRQAASRRVIMAEASVLQPYAMNSRSHVTGWSGAQGAMQYSITQPMVTVHPPPADYSVAPIQYSQSSHPSHRIHPPPHPGLSRPIARLPSTPTRSRKVSASPSKRTPSRKRVSESDSGGGFSWGETTFVNFTSADAEKLLTGVAPSGSQAKRKREEEARAQEDMMSERKRRRSGEYI